MSIIIPPAPVGTPFGDYTWIDWYQKVRRAINDVNNINHNDLQNIQGGSTNDYYHLTAAQHSAITTNINETIDDRVASLLVAGTNITLTYNDVANTLTIASTGGGGALTETVVDFGTKPVWDASFTVLDGSVTPTNKIIVTPGDVSSGRHADDWQWDSINFAAVAGTSQFTIYANCNGPVEGTRSIYYQVI